MSISSINEREEQRKAPSFALASTSTYILALTLLTAAGGDFVLISFTVRLRFFLQTAAG
jgi:hypothetical protein